jgi:hypothetical protein
MQPHKLKINVLIPSLNPALPSLIPKPQLHSYLQFSIVNTTCYIHTHLKHLHQRISSAHINVLPPADEYHYTHNNLLSLIHITLNVNISKIKTNTKINT